MSKSVRSYTEAEPALLELGKARETALAVRAGSDLTSDRYGRATVLLDAIDNLAEAITGDRETLWIKPTADP